MNNKLIALHIATKAIVNFLVNNKTGISKVYCLWDLGFLIKIIEDFLSGCYIDFSDISNSSKVKVITNANLVKSSNGLIRRDIISLIKKFSFLLSTTVLTLSETDWYIPGYREIPYVQRTLTFTDLYEHFDYCIPKNFKVNSLACYIYIIFDILHTINVRNLRLNFLGAFLIQLLNLIRHWISSVTVNKIDTRN